MGPIQIGFLKSAANIRHIIEICKRNPNYYFLMGLATCEFHKVGFDEIIDLAIHHAIHV